MPKHKKIKDRIAGLLYNLEVVKNTQQDETIRLSDLITEWNKSLKGVEEFNENFTNIERRFNEIYDLMGLTRERLPESTVPAKTIFHKKKKTKSGTTVAK